MAARYRPVRSSGSPRIAAGPTGPLRVGILPIVNDLRGRGSHRGYVDESPLHPALRRRPALLRSGHRRRPANRLRHPRARNRDRHRPARADGRPHAAGVHFGHHRRRHRRQQRPHHA
ncbi:hypothetical protein G6F59_016051 [Rhizopus arrhizus]|nr:hypothetical protein G6F59_016051 [Rhizopus arrhizus]